MENYTGHAVKTMKKTIIVPFSLSGRNDKPSDWTLSPKTMLPYAFPFIIPAWTDHVNYILLA